MIQAIVDPGSLAVPNVASTDELMRHLESLIDLSSGVNERWLELYCCLGVMEALASDNLLPLRAPLGELLQRFDVDDFEAHDIETIVLEVLTRLLFLEDQLEVSAVLSDNLRISPACLIDAQGPGVRGAQRSVLELGAVAIGTGRIAADTRYVSLLRPWPEVEVTGVIDMVEPASDKCTVSPGAFGATIEIVPDADALFAQSDAARLICEPFSLTEDVVTAAIRIAMVQLPVEGAPRALADAPNFKLGAKFVSSVAAVGARTSVNLAARVIVAAAEVVLQSAPRKSHALRSGKSGSAATIKRGRWVAQRHDVDYEVHLHYWRGPAGAVELASLVFHNDFDIPEPASG